MPGDLLQDRQRTPPVLQLSDAGVAELVQGPAGPGCEKLRCPAIGEPGPARDRVEVSHGHARVWRAIGQEQRATRATGEESCLGPGAVAEMLRRRALAAGLDGRWAGYSLRPALSPRATPKASPSWASCVTAAGSARPQRTQAGQASKWSSRTQRTPQPTPGVVRNECQALGGGGFTSGIVDGGS